MRWVSTREPKSINDSDNHQFINFNFSMELPELCAELESILRMKQQLVAKMELIMRWPIDHAQPMEGEDQTQLWMQKLRESQKMQIISSETVHRLEESLALLRKQEESLKARKDRKSREKQELIFKLKHLEGTAPDTQFVSSKQGRTKADEAEFKEDRDKHRLLQKMKKQLQLRKQQNQGLVDSIQEDDSRIETEQDSLLKHYQSYNKLAASAEELKIETRSLHDRRRQLEVSVLGETSERKKLMRTFCHLLSIKQGGWGVQIHKNEEIYKYLKEAVERWLEIHGQYEGRLGKAALTIESND